MVINQYQTQWVAAHLLFPNSAQANDVFVHIAPHLSEKEEAKIIEDFKQLSALYFKTQIIQSGLSFIEFDQVEFKIWPEFFKKISKEEVILLLGYVFFELSEAQIAKSLGLTQKYVQEKIKRTIYKVISKPAQPINIDYQFKFKKYDADFSTDFFIYDELIQATFSKEYVLNDQLKNKISQSTNLKKYFEQLQSFKNEILNLNEAKFDIPAPIAFIGDSQTLKINKTKKLLMAVPAVSVIVVCLAVLLYRPQFLQRTQSDNKAETIEIQQIKIDRHSEDKLTDKPTDKVADVDLPAKLPLAALNKKPVEVVAVEAKKEPTAKIAENAAAVTASAIKVVPEKTIAKVTEIPQQKVETKPNIKPMIKASGGLYRGQLMVTDVEQVIAAVKEKIIILGGKRAGEVELGWMKNETTSYFHFSFPEENKDDLETYLKQFGKVNLSYQPHPRVMPKGTRRYIIEIKQNE